MREVEISRARPAGETPAYTLEEELARRIFELKKNCATP
jgi:hypothetical protein